jgi:microcystin-dependent protein
MSDPYVGEIRIFGGNFAPVGWALCNGQLLSISEYEALFQLIGTTYGGDGVTTFALPNLQGRVPVHQGNGYPLGQAAGVESVTLVTAQMPQHSHLWTATSTDAEGAAPQGAQLAAGSGFAVYGAANPGKAVTMAASTLGPAGGSEPHDNMAPFLCMSFIIALQGIYPQQG